MNTPLELKVDRIEKMMIEAIEMIGRLESILSAKIDAVDAKVDSLSEEVKQICSDVDKSHTRAALRYITYEEDLRQMRMEFKLLEERVQVIEKKHDAGQ